MSSLAKQLKQLQIPGHFSGAAATKFKTKASLLFDAKEAADIDNETIYSLGINGLEELKAIEPSFAIFESTLFSESSKNLQRTLQTKEVNEKLDKQISKLLSCLSPYILLKPAQKIVEWLIRRFGVHIHNVDLLVCCILPYHETKLFARVIQILSISDPSAKWHWLEPLQKSGSPLPRSAVIQRCISDPSFLSLICEMVPQGIKDNCSVSSIRVLFTFYASTLVAVVEQMKRVTEKFITRLLPYLLKGLKSGTAELKAASYMIMGQLCVKCSLEEKLLKSVLESICKHLNTDLVLEGLMCVTCICHTQNVTILPKKAFRNLVKFHGLVQHLSKLCTTHDVRVLLNAFLPQLVTAALQECTGDLENHDDNSGNRAGRLLEEIVKNIELDNSIVTKISRGLLDGYVELRSQHGDNAVAVEALKLSVGVVAQHIDRRYPTQLEKALEEYLENLRKQSDEEMTEDDKSSTVQWVMEFVSLALSGVKSQVLPDTNATLVLSLHHPKAEVREMAVKHLGEMMRKQTFEEDERFIIESILPRLSDDNPRVVLGALNIGDALVGLLPADVLADKLFEHLRSKKDGWDAVRESCLNFLMNSPLINEPLLLDRVVFELISLLFLHCRSCDEGISMAAKIADSKLSPQHPLISGLKAFLKKKEWKNCNGDSDPETLAAANSVLLCWLGDNLAEMEDTRQLDMVTSMVKHAEIQSGGSLLPLIFCGILGRLVSIETQEYKLALYEQVFVLVKAELQKYTTSESLSCSDGETASPGVVPKELMTNLVKYKAKKKRPKKLVRAEASILMWLLGNLVKNMPCVKSASTESWWQLKNDESPEQKYTKILLSIFEVLAFGAGKSESPRQKSAFQELIKQFFEIHLADKLCLLRFLGLIWCDKPQGSSTNGFPAVLQIQSLHIACVCLGSVKGSDLKEIVKESCTVVPSLLVALCSPISAVRKSSITCLRNIATQAASLPASSVSYLVNNLLENAEDLSADPEQLQRVFTSLFLPLTDVQPVHDKSSAKLKAKRKAEEKALGGVLNYLTQHAVGDETPLYVRKTLLCVLSDVATESFLLESLPVINTLLEKLRKAKLSLHEAVCLQQLIKKFTPSTVSVLDAEPDAWHTLVAVISCQKPLLHVVQELKSPLSIILDQISNEFFKAIPSDSIQQDLLKLLLDNLLKTGDASLTLQIKLVMLQVYVDSNKIMKELCRPFEDEKKESKRKKLKRNEEEEGQSAVHQWQRVVGLLELLVQKDNIGHPQQLVPTLFALLSRCIEMDTSEQSSMDYTKQLLLSIILNVCMQLSPDGKPVKPGLLSQDQFDVELIVQCIRVSQNPQTHHHALLLLATAAQLFPEKVLHNVMSIFTFMGANVLRQDDSYSFQIITKTVETVIPALIKAGERQQIPRVGNKGAPASLDDSVAMVIRVFVDASPHVPEHRRLPLFTHLVSTVGASRFLYATIVLILERFIVHGAAEEDVGPVQNPLDVDFCASLCQDFELHLQVEAMFKLIKYVVELPSEKPTEEIHRARTPRRALTTHSPPHLLFDYHIHTAKQFRQFQFTLLGLIPTLLADEQFVSKVMDLKEQNRSSVDSMFHSILEMSLSFVTVTAKLSEQHSQDAGGKFWRAVLHRAYDIVDKVNQLLPLSAFVGVISRLVHNSNATVRRKAMELLNTKLTQGAFRYPGDQVEDILGLVDELVGVVKGSGDSEEVAINKQTALYSLKLLTKILAVENPQPFKKVIVVTIELFSVEDFNIQVASSALLCLAEVCSSLKVHAITYLPQFMPPLLSLLQKSGKERNDLLLLCAVTALHKVTEALPHFLSPYLVEVLARVTCPRLEGQQTSIADAKDKDTCTLTQLQEKLEILRAELAKTVTPRVLIPAVSQCYLALLDTSKASICTLMNILGECILGVKREHIKSLHPQLFAFFLTAMDFRDKHEKAGEAVVEKTEESVINAFLTLVMKLSEATFRPMFLKLVDWATRNNSPRNRLLAFYRLCDRIADKLKSLFVLFAGYIVKNCVHLLDANNSAKSDVPFFLEGDEEDSEESSEEDSEESSDEEDSDEEKADRNKTAAPTRKSCMLIKWVLDCLNKCFLYDTQGFVDKERFESLLQPLVDQLENSLGGAKAYQDRVTSHVVPCLAEFAVAAGDVRWKALNYQVLLKTRHPSSQVRFAALKVVEEFNNKLGEDFMVLLPETIPFLAELMEDECVEVEQQCQHVVSEIEAVLGESLQKYF